LVFALKLTTHQPHPAEAVLFWSTLHRREEFNCGKKQPAPDSETKASSFLKIPGGKKKKKERGLEKPLQ